MFFLIPLSRLLSPLPPLNPVPQLDLSHLRLWSLRSVPVLVTGRELALVWSVQS